MTSPTCSPVSDDDDHGQALSDVRHESYPRLRRVLITGDATAAGMAWGMPFVLFGAAVPRSIDAGFAAQMQLVLGGVAAIVITLALMAMQRLYLSRVAAMRTTEITRVGRVSTLVGIGALIAAKLIGEPHLARVPLSVAGCAFLFLNIWRMVYAMWLSSVRRNGRYIRSVLLIGCNDEAFELHNHFRRHPELGYRIYGVVGRESDYRVHAFTAPWLGELGRIDQILEQTEMRGAVVAGGALGRLALNRTIRNLLARGVHVHMSTGINGMDHRRMQSLSLAYEPMVYVERVEFERWQLILKRIMDLCIAGVVLVFALPLLVASAIAVKVYDRGPVFFVQERVGRHGNTFRIFKLRSMCIDAEDKLGTLREHNQREGPLFKLAKDPRVTPIGRVIRATSIDELPQLVNVLRGDMSLVGPRPALPSEVESFDDALRTRQLVMPGITGLWQVEGRDNPDFHLYQRLDIFYVENWSVMLDISILIGTVKAVVMRAWRALGRSRARYRVTHGHDHGQGHSHSKSVLN